MPHASFPDRELMSNESPRQGASGAAPTPAHDTTPGGDGADVKEAEGLLIVLPKVLYNEKTGKEIIVTQAIQDRVDQFIVSFVYRRTGSRDLTYFYSWGCCAGRTRSHR